MILFFFCTFDTVFPIKALSSSNNDSTSPELLEIFRNLPFPPEGVQDAQRLKRPQFHVHHAPDPVNALNGNLFLAYQDLFIPARGFPLEVSRTYNSRGTIKGVFGYGWSSSLDTTLEQDASGSIFVREWDGSVNIYDLAIQPSQSSRERIYRPPFPSVQSIIKETDGRFIRVLGNGKKEVFSPQGRLLCKEDAYGNGLRFIYDSGGKVLLGISDTSERHVWLKYTESGFIHTLTDPLNRTLTYDYDEEANLIGVTGFDSSVTRFSYDSDHNLTGITFPDGGRVTNVYDEANDRIVRQEGPGEKRTVYAYSLSDQGNADRETVVTDANENKATYTYSIIAGRVKRMTITDAEGGQTIREYDDHGNLIRRTDPNGNSTGYYYDSHGRMQSLIDPMGESWRFEFLEGCDCRDNRPALIRDPLDNITRFHYDARFELSEVVNAVNHKTKFKYSLQGDLIESVTEDGAQTQYQYDAYGNVIRRTDPNGNTVQYIRNTLGLVTELITPAGHGYKFRYDTKGRLIKAVNPLGYRVTLTYDYMDHVVRVADGDGKPIFEYSYNSSGQLEGYRDLKGNAVLMGYDAAGNRSKLKDATGNEWRFVYDNLSRLVEIIDPLNNKNLFEYDPAGNLMAAINPFSDRTVFSYDRDNRLTEITDPLGNRTRYQYDPLGNRMGMIDAEGHHTKYVYDALSRLVCVTNALGERMEYHRDARGNVIKQVDALGNQTQFQYDPGSRLVKMIDPLGNATTYEFNASDQISTLIKPDGRVVKFEYNPLNLLTKAFSDGGLFTNFSYDKQGRLIGASEGNSAYSYRYNELGLLTELQDISRKRTLRYKYDSRRNRIETAIFPEGLTTRYEYDSLSRMVHLTSPSGKAYCFGYDAAGRRSSLSFPNGVKTAYHYDAAGRLSGILARNQAGALLSRETYQYNRVGSMTTKVYKDKQSESYRYDSLNRLLEAHYPDQSYERFNYDAMGNIVSQSSSDEAVSYAYNKDSQLVVAGDTRFEYDPNGNLIRKICKDGTFRYRYDDFGRMKGVTLSDGRQVEHTYSPLWQRVVTKDKETETCTIFDGDHPVATLDQVLNVTDWTAFGPGFDEPLARESVGKTHFFHRNGLGSVTTTSNEKGAQISQVRYKAFGQPYAISGPLPLFSFAGRPFDPETGLIHFRFREYDPNIARFIQHEPMGLIKGWENSYAYASNNPISLIDVYGLWGWPSFSQVVGVVAIATVACVGLAAAAPALLGGTIIGTIATGVAGAATGLSTALGAAATPALVGGLAGATVSGLMAASGGKDVLEVFGDAVIGGAAGAVTAVAALGGILPGVVAGAGTGLASAWLTGGDPVRGALFGGAGGLAGGIIGYVASGAVRDYGVGVLAGGLTGLLDSVISWGEQTTTRQQIIDSQLEASRVPADANANCP
jgi:RHS repeat-associated protein